MINGVRATKADFRAIDPENISSFEMLTGEQARNVLGQIDEGHNVLLITTNDSEAGKKFREKIDRMNNSRLVFANNAYTITVPNGKNTSTTTGYGSWSTNVPRTKYHVEKFNTQGIASLNGKIAVTGNGDTEVLNESRGPDSTVTYGLTMGKGTSDSGGYTLGLTSRPPIARASSGRGYQYYSLKTMPFSLNMSSETSINHLSGKLIMIDGKEATEKDLKRLSAADIEGVAVKTGGETVKKYGDKAKNGVVFIVTRKEK